MHSWIFLTTFYFLSLARGPLTPAHPSTVTRMLGHTAEWMCWWTMPFDSSLCFLYTPPAFSFNLTPTALGLLSLKWKRVQNFSLDLSKDLPSGTVRLKQSFFQKSSMYFFASSLLCIGFPQLWWVGAAMNGACSEWGPRFVVVCRLLNVDASLSAETGSRHTGFSICSMWTHELWLTGPRTHGLQCGTPDSWSMPWGIFPDQGSNPRPLHWKEDSYPLYHQWSPK